jgi:hypothetical protein
MTSIGSGSPFLMGSFLGVTANINIIICLHRYAGTDQLGSKS